MNENILNIQLADLRNAEMTHEVPYTDARGREKTQRIHYNTPRQIFAAIANEAEANSPVRSAAVARTIEGIRSDVSKHTEDEFDGSYCLEFEQSFAVDLDLYIKIRPDFARSRNEDNGLVYFTGTCEINIPGCGRTVTETMVLADLLQKAALMAAKIENAMQRATIAIIDPIAC